MPSFDNHQVPTTRQSFESSLPRLILVELTCLVVLLISVIFNAMNISVTTVGVGMLLVVSVTMVSAIVWYEVFEKPRAHAERIKLCNQLMPERAEEDMPRTTLGILSSDQADDSTNQGEQVTLGAEVYPYERTVQPYPYHTNVPISDIRVTPEGFFEVTFEDLGTWTVDLSEGGEQ